MRYLTALVLVTAACAMQPGAGVGPEFSADWGCDHATVQARADTLARQLPDGEYYIPQVGWTACDVMAHIGKPQRVDLQASEYGRSANWWYGLEDYAGPTLVTLELRGSEWVVTYTGT